MSLCHGHLLCVLRRHKLLNGASSSLKVDRTQAISFVRSLASTFVEVPHGDELLEVPRDARLAEIESGNNILGVQFILLHK